MSMNLHLKATVDTTTPKGNVITVKEYFNLWQTPTKITYKILEHNSNDDIIEEYSKWCESVSKPYEDNVYDYNQPMNDQLEYPVIGKQMVYPAQNHIEELKAWRKHYENEGYEIEFFAL